jgi:hypothetical protein
LKHVSIEAEDSASGSMTRQPAVVMFVALFIFR